MRSWLPQWSKLLADAFAPARCMQCAFEGTWYCTSCRNNAPIALQSCIGCKTDRPRGTTCRSCREDIPLAGVVSAGAYSNHALQRGIAWLKFKGVRKIAEPIGGLLISKLPLIAPLDELSKRAVLVPIPLHKRKFQHRGFNQSEDIARVISTICNIELAPILVRTKATHSQAKLPHDQRSHNVLNAFALSCSQAEFETLAAKKPIIILVDDVTTTGATLIAAARALPPISERKIFGAVVARG
ncbi:MAG: hypothetical protein A3E36_00850 [Candidatus Andersenbacteria bacterium RIFCSPHIGHO2_12_FULL_45_11b]|uniref:Phosphoribosyltransferase domain-containing protein n=1 Tax=Candidatus Andersenbacteria bacterium RIFCSPHIGHO2_12_FULL_45_11b TaxID=1797282 RepID=A0A1G1XA08_9BACT|nr:MAG: hypothetical protein A3E36_00850 [Candidatus Andersenbacteria bacterium RIFCSPHIGHO2_12_FULL_45_11b]